MREYIQLSEDLRRVRCGTRHIDSGDPDYFGLASASTYKPEGPDLWVISDGSAVSAVKFRGGIVR